MERFDYSRIAHAGLEVMNPVAPAALDRIVARLELAPRARVVDLGCGKGDLLARIARSYDVLAIGVDRDAALLADVPSGIETVEADALEWVAGRSGFDLAVGVGGPAPLELLAGLVRDGGFVLHGEGYWRREPSEAYLSALGATADELPDVLPRAEQIGLRLVHEEHASPEDFDRYEDTWALTGERYAAAHRAEPGVAAFAAWIANGRRRYRDLGGRETLGFAVRLFRAD